MPEYTVQVEEAVAQSIRDTAKLRKIPEQQCVGQILAAHHEGFRRFPDGVLREGLQKIVALLSQIPCLTKFDSSGVDSRYWWVSFELDITSRLAWPVVRRLGLLLNTQSTEMMLPTVFKPTPSEWPDERMRDGRLHPLRHALTQRMLSGGCVTICHSPFQTRVHG